MAAYNHPELAPVAEIRNAAPAEQLAAEKNNCFCPCPRSAGAVGIALFFFFFFLFFF